MVCVFVQDEMASLNDKDRKWFSEEIATKVDSALRENKFVSDQISTAIEAFRPTGWRRFTHALKDWGAVGSAITGAIALLGIAITAVIFATGEAGRNAEFRGNTTQHLTNIDGTLSEIRLKLSTANPSDPANQAIAKKVLADAQSKSILIPEPTIQAAAQSFIAAAQSDPKAWDVATDLISYRTIENQNLLAVKTASDLAQTKEDPKLTSQYLVPFLLQYSITSMSVGGDVPENLAAQIYPIDHGPIKPPNGRGKEVIMIDGGGLHIDGTAFRRVVIRNSIIRYDGAPLRLDDVIFVNCTFVIADTPNGRAFAKAVLAQNQISLTTS